ncbi:MAG: Abi family protein [Coriobacteriia bacterium]|nr:Abi family protein [Coriobacteriia bacterium]
MTDALAENVSRGPKPTLAVSEQIAHLKSRGVTFELCSEAEAADYLRTANNLLRASSYRKLFPIKAAGAHAGEYAGLDFEHLRALSSLDRMLRACLLSIALDIEHFARIEILDACEEHGEDGYGIVLDYLHIKLNHKGRNHIEGGLKARGADGDTHDEYSGDLIAKHYDTDEHLDRMPAWVFLETIEFRVFTDFYLFCAERWGDGEMLQRHYVLKSVRALRNACAHNSCILNGVGKASKRGDWITSRLVTDSLNEHGMRRTKSRRDKLSNLRITQIAETLFADSVFCTRPHTTERHARMLGSLRSAWKDVRAIFQKNPTITSFFDFFFKLVDIWVPSSAEYSQM